MFLPTKTENVPLPPSFSSHHLSQCCFPNLTASSTETALVRLTGLCLCLYFDCILATALFLLTDPHRPRAGRPAGSFSMSLFLSPSPTHLLHIHVRALKSLNLKKMREEKNGKKLLSNAMHVQEKCDSDKNANDSGEQNKKRSGVYGCSKRFSVFLVCVPGYLAPGFTVLAKVGKWSSTLSLSLSTFTQCCGSFKSHLLGSVSVQWIMNTIGLLIDIPVQSIWICWDPWERRLI